MPACSNIKNVEKIRAVVKLSNLDLYLIHIFALKYVLFDQVSFGLIFDPFE